MENAENSPLQPQEVPQTEEQRSINRRQLLKLLGAGSAITAWSVLPDKWSKPVVEAGELSAFGDASRVDNRINISSLHISVPDGSPLPGFNGEFNFNDPGSGVTDSATLYAYLSPCNEIIFNNKAISSISGGHVSGGPTNGTIEFGFTPIGCPNSTNTFNVQLSAGGRSSNTLSGNLPAG